MKQIILVLTFIVIDFSPILCQNLSIGLSSGIGISPNSLASEADWITSEYHSNLVPLELSLNYLFVSTKKFTPFLGSGFKSLNNKYFQNLQSLEYGNNIKAISFSQNHLAIPIRIGAEVKLFNSNSIGIQYEFQYNLALKKEDYKGTEDFETGIFGSLLYSYSLTNRTSNFLSNLFSLFLKTQITPNLFVMSHVSYEIRPSTGDFDFLTDQIQTETDVNTGMQVKKQASYKKLSEDIKNNIIYFKVGITRQF